MNHWFEHPYINKKGLTEFLEEPLPQLTCLPDYSKLRIQKNKFLQTFLFCTLTTWLRQPYLDLRQFSKELPFSEKTLRKKVWRINEEYLDANDRVMIKRVKDKMIAELILK